MSISSPIFINNGVYRDPARSHLHTDNPAVVPLTVYATRHQVSVRPNAATTGTLALSGVPLGSGTAEVITDEAGDPVVFDLTSPSTVIVTGAWEEFQLVPTGVDGTYYTEAAGWLE